MRIRLLLAFLVLATNLNAQTWAPIGAKWTYKQGIWSGPDTNLAVIENVGDTVIAGLTFSVLEPMQGTFSCFPLHKYVHYDGDSLWFWDATTQDLHLLWCMNALPGQTWQTTLNWSGTPADTIIWTVVDTGSVIMDGIPLRELGLEYTSLTFAMSPWCWPNCHVTERLGNWKYFYDFQYGSCDNETFLGLRCYEDSDINWLNPQFAQCELGTAISELPSPMSIQVVPTLAQAGSPIELCGWDMTTHDFQVLDASGRMIQAGRWSGVLTFTLSDPGIYVVRIRDVQGSEQHLRMVVQ